MQKTLTRYKANHIRRLRDEAQGRCNRLLDLLHVPTRYSGEFVLVDGSKVRVAVDDFKSVLSEIRRLK